MSKFGAVGGGWGWGGGVALLRLTSWVTRKLLCHSVLQVPQLGHGDVRTYIQSKRAKRANTSTMPRNFRAPGEGSVV